MACRQSKNCDCRDTVDDRVSTTALIFLSHPIGHWSFKLSESVINSLVERIHSVGHRHCTSLSWPLPATLALERRYTKRSLMSWVVVIAKQGRAHMAAPALLLVWHWLFRFMTFSFLCVCFFFCCCFFKSRGCARPSFGMTTTQDISIWTCSRLPRLIGNPLQDPDLHFNQHWPTDWIHTHWIRHGALLEHNILNCQCLYGCFNF